MRVVSNRTVRQTMRNVYALDLFVRVPSSLAAPIVYTPMEVDAINQVADGREPTRRVT